MRLTLLVAFFALATLITVAAGVSLLVPGTLDGMWSIKREEHAALAAWAPASGAGFLALGAIMAATAVGLHLRRSWGRWLAVGVFAANGLGDAVRGLTGAVLEGLIGVAVTGALILWLTRPSVRAQFGKPAVGGAPWLS